MEEKKRKFERKEPLPHSTFGFGIGDCPVWLYKEFRKDVKEKYQDKHWVKLMDLVRKAEAYDAFVATSQCEDEHKDFDEPEQEQQDLVQTLGE